MNNQKIPTSKNYTLLAVMIGFVVVVISITLMLVLLSMATSTTQMMTIIGAFLLIFAVAYFGLRYLVHTQG